MMDAMSLERKIPEGWPTEEMRQAFFDADDEYINYRQKESKDGRGWLPRPDYILRKMFAAAPTPPAQEVEPVAYMDRRGHFWSVDRVQAELEEGNLMELRPVYTAPQNDELRKAAEAILPLIQKAIFARFVADFDQDGLMNAAVALSKALGKP